MLAMSSYPMGWCCGEHLAASTPEIHLAEAEKENKE